MTIPKSLKIILMIGIAAVGITLMIITTKVENIMRTKKIAKILEDPSEADDESAEYVEINSADIISKEEAVQGLSLRGQKEYYHINNEVPSDFLGPTATTIIEWRDAHPEQNVVILGYYRGYVICRRTLQRGEMSIWGLPPYWQIVETGSVLQPAQTIVIKGGTVDPALDPSPENMALYSTNYEDKLLENLRQMQTNIDIRISQFNSPKYSPTGTLETEGLYPF